MGICEDERKRMRKVELERRVQEVGRMRWEEQLQRNERTRRYAQEKGEMKLEQYADGQDGAGVRLMMRGDCLPVRMNECVRWKYGEDERRCTCGEEETERHVLFECVLYERLREEWLRRWREERGEEDLVEGVLGGPSGSHRGFHCVYSYYLFSFTLDHQNIPELSSCDLDFGNGLVTIGRSPDVTICLMSTMISRRHAVLKKKDAEWTVMDNKSINGVYVNEHQLTPLEDHQLKDGDVIRVGVPAGPDQPLSFVWSYHKQLKVAKTKRRIPEGEGSEEEKNSTKKSKPNPIQNELSSKAWSPSAKANAKMKEAEAMMAEKLRLQEQRLAEMQRQLQEKTAAEERLQAILVEKEKTMQLEIKQQKDELEKEKEILKNEIREKYEKELHDKEETLFARLAFERDELQQEREVVESKLREEKERQGESDKERQIELAKECERLSKIIEKKESEQRMLKTELKDTKSESAKQKGEMLEAREELLRNFANLMETELQCSICNELLIQATSLNCSHSFCSMCISEWMAVKKECPVCRAAITSHLKAIVLDSYIDRMVEHFSDDMKELRKTLVAERKAEAERKKAEEQSKEPQPTTSRQRTIGGRARGRRAARRARGGAAAAAAAPLLPEPSARRGGGRRRGGRAARRTNEAPPAPPADVQVRRGARVIVDVPGESQELDAGAPEVININESVVIGDPIEIPSDDDDIRDPLAEILDNSDSSDAEPGYVRGVPGSYYGGFGTCFRCGNRGHWAPGCPLG
ncbi:hypothetical protein CAPTEDRAFT_202625 [Capitella teleta]|uniref:E3 ubiquitin-protein ligase CHFR n=1 Tax=Capitella teleta TaxID=283909 RepID=R7TVG6_CAPTE|nr:hypothetical protein CAPTEDRAFT_202625 [Capitella teleta]|eukprot:ELT95456.1 hypothetical protein CAPTEDRAFT_202625 [Capitella teleta]